MEILEVQPLRMVPPEGFASNSGNVSDFDSSKVAASWLPPGWTVENRTKSCGSSYKVYKDLDTGMKFYSRTKVLEYLQNPTSRRTPIKRSRAETTPCNEHPNWLPPDWVVELKTKMSGGTVGKKYKVYVEKSTGKTFYSIRQVLDYLKPSNSSSPETKDAQSTGSEDHPDWYPKGWKTETESDDGAAERKDKVTDTEREVTNVVEGLPPGWFKAIRYRESRAGSRYKVAHYVDPISGYAFFSTKDALRYIDNGHIKDCRMKPTLWSKISNDIVGNKFHSQPTAQERELKPEGRKGKRPLLAEGNYEEKSEEDIIDIDDSDKENGSTPKEMRVKSLFSEEISEKKSEDVTEPDDSPIGAEKAGTAEMEKEKMPEAQVLKRTRVKVCATKGSPSLCSSKSTSPKALPSNPSSVNPVQTNQKDNGENPESEQMKDILEQASSQQVDEVSPSSLPGDSSLDSCLEFAFKTLTEDILVLDKR
ncbi:Methyl-CpG-binding domain-containing protein 6 [Carex littledalei]|uniref:Methyl-CpG-binding domain-containing protein 6 n=1 Tax=Carex littledalei TaxID=544730 RepID=A0A833RGL1_9POAL|nr:Methyl-CpG-binding domain-containing protein 6 [Carex littledalei]